MMTIKNEPLIEVRDLRNKLSDQWVHDGLNFTVNRGEIVAIIGPSGCGKTILLRSILMLQKPTSGDINVFGINLSECTEREALSVQRRWGVMFQSSALLVHCVFWKMYCFLCRNILIYDQPRKLKLRF